MILCDSVVTTGLLFKSQSNQRPNPVLYLFAVLLSEAGQSPRGVKDEVSNSHRSNDEEGDGDEEHRVLTHPETVLLPKLYCYGNRHALL